jgi:hypothetical protein
VPRESLQAGALHRHGNGVVADDDPAAHGELRVDPQRPIGSSRLGVDAGDEIGEPGVTDLPRRRRPGSPRVVAGVGDLEHRAADLCGVALIGHPGDGRELVFVGTTSLSSSLTRLLAASSPDAFPHPRTDTPSSETLRRALLIDALGVRWITRRRDRPGRPWLRGRGESSSSPHRVEGPHDAAPSDAGGPPSVRSCFGWR